jgi:hypothetical protein
MEIRSEQDLDAALRITEMERVRKLVACLRGRQVLMGQPQLIIQIPLLILLLSRLFSGDRNGDAYLVGALFLVTIATSVVHEVAMRRRVNAMVELLELRGLLSEASSRKG